MSGTNRYLVRKSSSLFDLSPKQDPVVVCPDIPYTNEPNACKFKHILDIFIPIETAKQVDLPVDAPPQGSLGAPRWLPNESSKICCSCKTNFSLFVRRHHCRRCGQLFCARCNSSCCDFWTEMPVEWGVDGVQRTCRRCFGFSSTDHLSDGMTLKRQESRRQSRVTKLHRPVSTSTSVNNEQSNFTLSFRSESSHGTFSDLNPVPVQRTDQPNERALLPVVVFIHGGAWKEGDKVYYFDAYGKVGRHFARSGFIGVVINYRLAPKFKHPTQVLTLASNFKVNDCALALRWVHNSIHSYGGDKDRVFLVGHSAGAHIAALLTLDSSFLAQVGLHPYQTDQPSTVDDHFADHALSPGFIKGVVPMCGPYNLMRFNCVPILRSYLITGCFSNWSDQIRHACPATCLEQPNGHQMPLPPMLFMNAEYDWGLQKDAVDLMQKIQEQRGHNCEHRMYKGTNHISIMSDFFERFLKDMRPHVHAMNDIVDFIDSVLRGEKPSTLPNSILQQVSS